MLDLLQKWREERHLQKEAGNYQANIAEELTELLRAKDVNEEIDALCDIIVFSINAIEAKGYNAELCMLETIKEISSRTGGYNPVTKKWEKFKTEEAKKKWYQADYTACIKN